MGVREPHGVRLDTPVTADPPAPEPEPAAARPPAEPSPLSRLPQPLRVATRAIAALCVAASLVHVLLVFLQVAPTNPVSQRYSKQIGAWMYPLFEQNWRLFAPDPESAVPQISARTLRTSSNGSDQVSGWFDLTAVDNAAVRHSVFPSHTAQNMLRRAWSGYLDTHGNGDGAYSDRAVMWQEYLRNIAVQRVAAARHTTFAAIQLRVRTTPVMAESPQGRPRRAAPSAIETRYLPWWKASAHDN